jgi:hypothetical protein
MTHVLTLSQHSVGYEQHTLAPSVDGTHAQAPPLMASDDTVPAGPIVVDGHNECTIMSSGQSLIYRCGVEIDYRQPTSSTVEFDVDEFLEYRRGCSSATFEKQEPLTLIQRRRQAQNRAAYVFRRSWRTMRCNSFCSYAAQYRVDHVRGTILESKCLVSRLLNHLMQASLATKGNVMEPLTAKAMIFQFNLWHTSFSKVRTVLYPEIPFT